MASIKDIIKSRFKEKEEWYHDRLEKCLSCTNWSSNKEELKGKDLAWKIANLGKDFCTICGCPENKLRLESEACPIGKWREIKQHNTTKYTVENKTDRVSLTYDTKFSKYYLDFGSIIMQDSTDVELFVPVSDDSEIRLFLLNTSCGCTKATYTKTSEGYIIHTTYRKKVGTISQNITFTITEKNNQIHRTQISLRGEIKN